MGPGKGGGWKMGMIKVGCREMPQWLRVHSDLSEDLFGSWNPYQAAYNCLQFQLQVNVMPSSGLFRKLHLCVHTYTHS